MKGVRFLGLVFSFIFAFGTGLIGFAATRLYLNLPIFKKIDGPPTIWYNDAAAVAFTLIGALVGFLIGSMLYRRIIEFGQSLRRIPSEDKLAVIFGTILSFIPAFFFNIIIWQISMNQMVKYAIMLLLSVLVIWLFNVIALSMKEELKFFGGAHANKRFTENPQQSTPAVSSKILDTNVIIDGRIYDVCRSGFLDGPVILPGFILEELQHIADSADALRRNRGRRGLDILYQMQKELDTTVRIMDRYKVAFAPGDPVDIKLVKLAKSLGNADLVTNDYNLNKVAKLHGVRVLNINELANFLKPVVLPGEEMTISIVKEGKEYNQGVGYLDDGTMVVVEGGRKLMGTTVTVAVASVLQTVAGKMIFAEVQEAPRTED